MMIVQCFECLQPIYRLKHVPQPGSLFKPEQFESLLPRQHPDPQHGAPMVCPWCGEFPFVSQNTGYQVLTIEEGLLP
ncbi:MAG: hypothetical protein K2X01_11420 [Cyanobacteria bacterium]|nr:hypothetical protein [Cyanobacteriota bacterium]